MAITSAKILINIGGKIFQDIMAITSANNTIHEAKLAITSAIITGNNISLVVLT